jgi:hypothetical protein
MARILKMEITNQQANIRSTEKNVSYAVPFFSTARPLKVCSRKNAGD